MKGVMSLLHMLVEANLPASVHCPMAFQIITKDRLHVTKWLVAV
jgi:hypothetical protein